jgi:hypothetical protein
VKYTINIKGNLPAIALLAAIVSIWEIICRAVQVPEFILPAPSSIITALIENRFLLLEHTAVTLSAVGGGLILAIIAALVIAVAMDRWKLLKGCSLSAAGHIAVCSHFCPGAPAADLVRSRSAAQGLYRYPGLFLSISSEPGRRF